uniref:SpaA isopeptide-forming pilin-related protein n=1 Tax=Eubacterium cellulosolvens TaxID=29322 RepID=UPI000483786D|nr:SpaA isopeptide-forming pilin-related protein [[Eubacterium] cellulosolvens]
MKRRWAVMALCAMVSFSGFAQGAVSASAGCVRYMAGADKMDEFAVHKEETDEGDANSTSEKRGECSRDPEAEAAAKTEKQDVEAGRAEESLTGGGKASGQEKANAKENLKGQKAPAGNEVQTEKEELSGQEENADGASFRTPEEIGFLPLAEMEDCWTDGESAPVKRRLLLQGSAPRKAAGFGGSAGVSVGSELSYPYTDNITHYFNIEYGSLKTTGFCGNSSKFGQSGNYPVQYLNEGAAGSMSAQTAAMIKMVMLMYPLFSQNIYNEAMQQEAGRLPLLRTEAYRASLARRFVGIHAIVSYLNSGDVYGLTDDEKKEISLAVGTLKGYAANRPDLVEKVSHFRLYRSAPADANLQSVLWLVPDAHVQIMKTGVNPKFEADSSLCTYAGAKYGVYRSLTDDGKPDPDAKMDTITLDENGFGKTEDSFRYTYGQVYYVQEEKAPAGYLLNPSVTTCRADDRKADQNGDGRPDVSGRGNYIGAVTDKERCATGVRFVKVGENKNLPVVGARFRIRFTGKDQHERTWIFRTGKNGELDLAKAEEYLEPDSPNQLYTDDVGTKEQAASGKSVFLPGVYVMREISAPEGYEILDRDFTAEVVEDDSAPGGALWKWTGKAAGEFQEIVIDGKSAGMGLKDPEEVEIKVKKAVNRVSNHIGQIQTWTIRSEIKGRMYGSDQEVFEIRDSFDAQKKRLDYMGNVRVEAEGIEENLTSDDYTVKESPVGTPGGSVTISFRASGRKKLGKAKNCVVTVRIDTAINANTGYGEEKASIPNQAEIYYNNGRTKQELVTNKVSVYTGKIGILKKDSNGQPLSGVEFALYTKKDGAYCPVIRKAGKILTDHEEGYDPNGEVLTVTTNANGEAEFQGLGEDDATKSRTYYLKETKTASSYSLIGDYISVEMKRGLANGGKAVAIINDPLLTLYAGGTGRLLPGFGVLTSALIFAYMLRRRREKQQISC